MNGTDFIAIFTDIEVGNWINLADDGQKGILAKIVTNCYGTISRTLFDSIISDLVTMGIIFGSGSRYDELQSYRPPLSPTDNNYVRENDLNSAITGKQDEITPMAKINDAATNSPNDATTNLNVITTLLGTLTGEVNNSNSKQNQIANDLRDLSAKFNTLIAALRIQGLQLTS